MSPYTENTPKQKTDCVKHSERPKDTTNFKLETTLQIVSEQLADVVDLPPSSCVLDVAAGVGNASLAFARRFHRVTALEASALHLEIAKARANSECLSVRLKRATPDVIPFDNNSFDAVVSAFGITYVADPKTTASELIRVLRPGGRVGLTCWLPSGFLGQVISTFAGFDHDSSDLDKVLHWGEEQALAMAFRDAGQMRSFVSRFLFRYRDTKQLIVALCTFNSGTKRLFLSLEEAKKACLISQLEELIRQFNRADDGTVKISSQFLEVVILT